ncbi:hypothetical protein [Streptomyces hokutonensis]|uniref:hypothetical protein n=1 Tax=Streptomyces hokutonensis TaxID=1306990 RepID=UPI0036B02787
MHRSESSDPARDLEEGLYGKMVQAFSEGRLILYQLSSPPHTPCALGECHEVNGSWQSATLIYGPWDTDREHVRVSTWRELPGQLFHPDTLPDIPTAPSHGLEVTIDGRPVLGELHRGPQTWQWQAAVEQHKILMSGRGAIEDLTLETVTDIAPFVDARRRHIAIRRPH